MYSEVSSRRFMLVVVKIVLMLNLFSKSASAVIEGDLELLKLVANGYKANLSKLATWQGKAIVFVDFCDTANNNPLFKTVRRKSSVEFIFDAERDAVRWYWNKLEGQVTRKKDMQPVTEKPYFTSGIVKEKTLYRLFPVPPTPERPPGNVIIKPVLSPIQGWNDEFHPMFYFQSIEGDWYERLMFYYEEANSTSIGNGRVWRKANTVFFETLFSNITPAIITYYEFDLSKGCCITKYVRKRKSDPNVDPSMSQVSWDYDYKEVDGVFVPKDITFSQVNSDGSEKTTRVIQFVQNITNKPIEAEEFSLAKLRLIPGDRVQNSATSVIYKYNDNDKDR